MKSVQNGSKWIKIDQNSTFYKFLIINLLALDNNKMVICFRSDSIRSVQIGSNLIKLDKIWIFHLSKNVNMKSCHIYHENNHGQLFLTRSDEICPKWIKMDQTRSNLDFSPIKKC